MDTPLLYKRLGAIIKERRSQLGLTQEQLSRQLKISRASLANIETGRQRVPVHRLYHIADKLDIKVARLLPESSEVQDLELLGDLDLSDNVGIEDRQDIANLLLDDRPASGSRGQHGRTRLGRTGKRATS